MSRKIFPLIFLLLLSLIYSKTITTTDLASAISQASAGDIIQIKSGIYKNVPYRLKSGSQGSPITIKAAPGATVTFTGTASSCIFDVYSVSYVNIEGPFELKNALCGAKIMNANYVNISGLTVHDVQQQGIVVSGHNNHIFNNEVYNCVMENKATAKSKDGGWSQCVAVWGVSYGVFSTNIIFEKNKIHEGYGEGLDFLECENCKAIGNEITNGFSMNIYVDASKNIEIDSNVLRVNTDTYNTKWGRACGIGMAPESGKLNIDNILITNNIIIGTRMGIYFFTMANGGGYNNVKILHNTLWNVFTTPVWFRPPTTGASNCEMKNNFFYVDGIIDFNPKSAWSLGHNYYYNINGVPGIYSDSSSMAAKSLDISTIFDQVSGCSDYWNQNLDVKCLRPSRNPGLFKLYHSGEVPKTKVVKDFSGTQRSTSSPSIGAYENASTEIPDEPPVTDAYDVKFKINYCTSYQVIKIVGSHCNWSVSSCPTMNHEGNCVWSTTIPAATSKTFIYKFLVATGNTANRWENDPNRQFNGASLASLANRASSGKYETCSYTKSGKVITLECSWR